MIFVWIIIFILKHLSNNVHFITNTLKTLDTIGYCQRPVFSLGVSQHMLENNKVCETLSSMGLWSCKIIMKGEKPLVTQSCVLSNAWFSGPQNLILRSQNQISLQNYFTSEGAVSQDGLYHQQLSITRLTCTFLYSFHNKHFNSPKRQIGRQHDPLKETFYSNMAVPCNVMLLEWSCW